MFENIGVLLDEVSDAFARIQPDLVIASLDWDASQVSAHILADIVRQAHGLEVAIRPTEAREVLPQIADPDGGLHVHPDLWLQNQPENIATYIDGQGPVTLNDHPYLGTQGLYMPRVWAERLGIDGLDDLAAPDIAAHFDEDGDGRGEIWVGADGWLSTSIMRDVLRDTGLDRHWEEHSFSDRIMKAKLADFMTQDRPLLFYGYEPDWIHSVYDLSRITEGPPTDLRERCPEDMPDALCALRSVEVHVAFSRRLLEDRPEVARPLERISFNTKDVNGWLSAITLGVDGPNEVAADWLTDNAERVAGWIARN